MTLEEKVKEGAEYCSRSQRIEYCLKVAYILRSMHFENICHTNLIPSNIIIIKNQVKLSEIGLLRLLELESIHKFGQKLYLTNYSTPEYILEKAYGLHSDIWNLGMITWQMISKTQPYSEKSSLNAASFSIMRGETPTLTSPSFSHWTCDIRPLLTSCWAKNAGERPIIVDFFGKLNKVHLGLLLPDKDSFSFWISLLEEKSKLDKEHIIEFMEPFNLVKINWEKFLTKICEQVEFNFSPTGQDYRV